MNGMGFFIDRQIEVENLIAVRQKNDRREEGIRNNVPSRIFAHR